MARPPLEVADLIRAAGDCFPRTKSPLARVGSTSKCCGPFAGVVPPHSAVISMSAPAADIVPPSPITAAAIAIARSVRPLRGTAGSLHARENFSPPAICTWSSHCPIAWLHWCYRTRRSSTVLLFRTSAETLLEVARDPKHLGAEIGFFSVLHTWSQKLKIHPHVHCVVPAGGLSLDHTRWVRSRDNYFLPKEVLREIFRGKFVAALEQAFQNGQLRFEGDLKLLAQPKIFAAWLRPLFRQDWVVYLKRPFGGPAYVLHYLGRYTHRVAISNHRLVSLSDGQVTFRWRDSAHHNEQKLLSLSLEEFLCRFLLHILPKGFVRIRNFGFLANRKRATLLPLCFQLLGSAQQPQAEQHASSTEDGPDLWRCPKCGGPMKVIERLTAAEIQLRSPPRISVAA